MNTCTAAQKHQSPPLQHDTNKVAYSGETAKPLRSILKPTQPIETCEIVQTVNPSQVPPRDLAPHLSRSSRPRAAPSSTETFSTSSKYGAAPFDNTHPGDAYIVSGQGTLFKFARFNLAAGSPTLEAIMSSIDASTGAKRKSTHPPVLNGLPVFTLPCSDATVYALLLITHGKPLRVFDNRDELFDLISACITYDLKTWLPHLAMSSFSMFVAADPLACYTFAFSKGWDLGAQLSATAALQLSYHTILDPKSPLASASGSVPAQSRLLLHRAKAVEAACLPLGGTSSKLRLMWVLDTREYAWFKCNHVEGEKEAVFIGQDARRATAPAWFTDFCRTVKARLQDRPCSDFILSQEVVVTATHQAHSYCKECGYAAAGDLAKFNRALAKYVDHALSKVRRTASLRPNPADVCVGRLQHVRLLRGAIAWHLPEFVRHFHNGF